MSQPNERDVQFIKKSQLQRIAKVHRLIIAIVLVKLRTTITSQQKIGLKH
jgi:hypothetical protein